MPEDMKLTDPRRYGLSSFAELLAPRDPLIGEDPGTYEAVHAGLMASLTPMTAYECVIAENLVAIEWEILQHRKLREDLLRQKVHSSVVDAVVDAKRQEHDHALDDTWEVHLKNGGTEDDWEAPTEFDHASAHEFAENLTDRAMEPDMTIRTKAWEELRALGINFTDIMSKAYFPGQYAAQRPVSLHESAVMGLEKRRREVMRDYDQLQRLRLIEAEVIDE